MVNVVSLGWNCDPAIISTNLGLRQKKSNGYNTCPFDLMMSSHHGVVKCLSENFERFFDLEADGEIVNQEYGFVFNHESPYQFDDQVGRRERWSSPDFYIENNMKRFRDRYSRRIESFYNYLNSSEPVIFLHQGAGLVSTELDEVISYTYPNLSYAIVDLTHHNREIENEFLSRFGGAAKSYVESLDAIGNCFPYNYPNMNLLPKLFNEIKRKLK